MNQYHDVMIHPYRLRPLLPISSITFPVSSHYFAIPPMDICAIRPVIATWNMARSQQHSPGVALNRETKQSTCTTACNWGDKWELIHEVLPFMGGNDINMWDLLGQVISTSLNQPNVKLNMFTMHCDYLKEMFSKDDHFKSMKLSHDSTDLYFCIHIHLYGHKKHVVQTGLGCLVWKI